MLNAVTSRLTGIVMIVPRAAFGAVNCVAAVAGIAGSILSIITLGRVRIINDVADLTYASKGVCPEILKCALGVINPNFKEDSHAYHSPPTPGFITKKVAQPIFQKAESESKIENSWFRKHVVTRGAYALGAIVAIITRTADLILGLCAIPLVLVTAGTSLKLNKFVFAQLEFFMVIDSFFTGIRGMVHPQQFV